MNKKAKVNKEKKYRAWNKGLKTPLEVREKLRLAKLGKKRPPFTEEHKRRIGKANKGNMTGKVNGAKSQFKKGQMPHNFKNWITKKPGYKTLYEEVRRTRLAGNGGKFNYGEWETLKAQYNWTCPCCKRGEPNIKLTMDHIIPVSKGGSSNIENIQPLCRSCNSKKHNKVIKYEI